MSLGPKCNCGKSISGICHFKYDECPRIPIRSLPSPDFEAALETELHDQYYQHVPGSREASGFEAGAHWAFSRKSHDEIQGEQAMALIKEAAEKVKEGPWKVKDVTVQYLEDADFYQEVSDGTHTIVITENNDEDAAERIANLFNDLQVELRVDNKYEEQAMLLENENRWIREELNRLLVCGGMRWVRVTTHESLPVANKGDDKRYIVRGQFADNNSEVFHNHLSIVTAEEMRQDCQGFEWYEWLDDQQPAERGEDAIGFAQYVWCTVNAWDRESGTVHAPAIGDITWPDLYQQYLNTKNK